MNDSNLIFQRKKFSPSFPPNLSVFQCHGCQSMLVSYHPSSMILLIHFAISLNCWIAGTTCILILPHCLISLPMRLSLPCLAKHLRELHHSLIQLIQLSFHVHWDHFPRNPVTGANAPLPLWTIMTSKSDTHTIFTWLSWAKSNMSYAC